jgi:hypothetical protein
MVGLFMAWWIPPATRPFYRLPESGWLDVDPRTSPGDRWSTCLVDGFNQFSPWFLGILGKGPGTAALNGTELLVLWNSEMKWCHEKKICMKWFLLCESCHGSHSLSNRPSWWPLVGALSHRILWRIFGAPSLSQGDEEVPAEDWVWSWIFLGNICLAWIHTFHSMRCF